MELLGGHWNRKAKRWVEVSKGQRAPWVRVRVITSLLRGTRCSQVSWVVRGWIRWCFQPGLGHIGSDLQSAWGAGVAAVGRGCLCRCERGKREQGCGVGTEELVFFPKLKNCSFFLFSHVGFFLMF